MEAEEERKGTEPSCPMASMCQGMRGKPPITLLLLPGIVLVLAGVVILLEPRVLAWLVAVASIAMGLAVMFLASQIRRWAGRSR